MSAPSHGLGGAWRSDIVQNPIHKATHCATRFRLGGTGEKPAQPVRHVPYSLPCPSPSVLSGAFGIEAERVAACKTEKLFLFAAATKNFFLAAPVCALAWSCKPKRAPLLTMPCTLTTEQTGETPTAEKGERHGRLQAQQAPRRNDGRRILLDTHPQVSVQPEKGRTQCNAPTK